MKTNHTALASLLAGIAVLAGCSERNATTAPSARPLAGTAALVDRPYTWSFKCNGDGLLLATWSWTENGTVLASSSADCFGSDQLSGTGGRPGADAAAAGPNGGSLVELSRPNAVGTCNTGFNAFGTWPTDEAEEPYVAVNPVHPNNIVAAWTQGPFQDIIAAASFDGGQTWQQVPLPLTVCSGGPVLGTGDEWLSFAPNVVP